MTGDRAPLSREGLMTKSSGATGAGSRLGMALEDWPPQDRLAWQAAFRPSSLLEPRPNGTDMADTTRIAMQTCYARWLVWLTTYHPETLPMPPSARATEERVIAYFEALHA